MDDNDIRDRLARAEQDIKNHKENFMTFKQEDFGSLKREVHTMHCELNDKIDILLEKVSNINLTMAKWVGAAGTVIFIGQFILEKMFKG